MKLRLAVAGLLALSVAACSSSTTHSSAGPNATTAPPATATTAATTAVSAPPKAVVKPDPLGTPAAGQCWSAPANKKELLHYVGKQVPCSGTHAYETYAVLKVVGSIATKAKEPIDAVSSQVNAVCVDAAGGNDAPKVTGSHYPDYTIAQEQGWAPSAALWAKGARWVRCDLGIGADGPHPLKGALHGYYARTLTPADRLCVAGFAQSSTLVPCSKVHDFEEVGIALVAGPFAPYPGSLEARATAQCQTAARKYVGTSKQVATHELYPESKGWSGYGIRQITCELALSHPALGSLRGTGRLP